MEDLKAALERERTPEPYTYEGRGMGLIEAPEWPLALHMDTVHQREQGLMNQS